jgi:hypothetical protein
LKNYLCQDGAFFLSTHFDKTFFSALPTEEMLQRFTMTKEDTLMNLRLSALFAIPLFAFSAASFAASQPQTCATKQQQIKTQLDYAHQHNNKDQIAGLQKALSENQAHCTDAGLKAEYAKHVAEKQKKVEERAQELKEAQATGDSKKIEKKQHKLDEAQSELKEAQGQ